ncbi:UNVERIFIED_CONTAM: hypothetical protein RMT77_006142 [Armadillidium vulgare]
MTTTYFFVFHSLNSLLKSRYSNQVIEGNCCFDPENVSSSVESQQMGTCSWEASLAGSHTRVISYSFSPSKVRYWIGFNQTLNNISRLYPGWLVRVYATKEDILFLQSKITPRKFLYFCDVNNLPYPLNWKLVEVSIPLWRFAAIGDPNIDVVMFRDSDSMIIEREYHAVEEWLNSTKTLHIMRDSIGQDGLILAGLFGLKISDSNRGILTDIRDKMFAVSKREANIWQDQRVLEKFLWPVFQNDVLAHDSFYCLKFKGTSPLPTKRDGMKKIAMR